MASPKSTLSLIRQALLLILLFGVVGTEAELLLLNHTDGFWQLIPVALNAITLVAIGWYALARSAASIRAIQCIMVVCLISGGVGVVHHFNANVRDAAESNPGLTRREVYLEATEGTTPALAPGTMVQLALIGLAFSYRHPRLGAMKDDAETH